MSRDSFFQLNTQTNTDIGIELYILSVDIVIIIFFPFISFYFAIQLTEITYLRSYTKMNFFFLEKKKIILFLA